MPSLMYRKTSNSGNYKIGSGSLNFNLFTNGSIPKVCTEITGFGVINF